MTERITEADVIDPERERYDSWAQCSQCHRPDVAIDQRDGMCADCYVAVTAP